MGIIWTLWDSVHLVISQTLSCVEAHTHSIFCDAVNSNWCFWCHVKLKSSFVFVGCPDTFTACSHASCILFSASESDIPSICVSPFLTQMLDITVNLTHLNSILYGTRFNITFTSQVPITPEVKEWHIPLVCSFIRPVYWLIWLETNHASVCNTVIIKLGHGFIISQIISYLSTHNY